SACPGQFPMISELVPDLEQVEDDAALVADVTVRRQRVFVALNGSTQVAVFRHQVSEVAQRHRHIFLVAELTSDGQALLVRALRRALLDWRLWGRGWPGGVAGPGVRPGVGEVETRIVSRKVREFPQRGQRCQRILRIAR